MTIYSGSYPYSATPLTPETLTRTAFDDYLDGLSCDMHYTLDSDGSARVGNNGTLNGTPAASESLVRAAPGAGIAGDGVDDYLSFTPVAWPSAWTLVLPFKMSATKAVNYLFSNGTVDATSTINIYCRGTLSASYPGLAVRMNDGSGNGPETAPTTGLEELAYVNAAYNDGKRHVLFVVAASGSVSLYFDALLVDTHIETFNPAIGGTATCNIGRRADGGSTTYFEGSWDEPFRIPSALTATQIRELYQLIMQHEDLATVAYTQTQTPTVSNPTFEFDVVYQTATDFTASSFQDGDVYVTRGAGGVYPGYSQDATVVSVTDGGSGSWTVRYSVPAPDGHYWTQYDNGSYRVRLRGDRIADKTGRLFLPEQILGSTTVAIAGSGTPIFGVLPYEVDSLSTTEYVFYDIVEIKETPSTSGLDSGLVTLINAGDLEGALKHSTVSSGSLSPEMFDSGTKAIFRLNTSWCKTGNNHTGWLKLLYRGARPYVEARRDAILAGNTHLKYFTNTWTLADQSGFPIFGQIEFSDSSYDTQPENNARFTPALQASQYQNASQDGLTGLINTTTSSALATLRARNSTQALLIPNYEEGFVARLPSALNEYWTYVMRYLTDADPSRAYAFYGVDLTPQRVYTLVDDDPSGTTMQRWFKLNKAFASTYAAVSVVCSSSYFSQSQGHDTGDNYRHEVAWHVALAKLQSGGKPVMPYLRFGATGGTAPTADDWTAMLNAVYDLADGAVIWEIATSTASSTYSTRYTAIQNFITSITAP